MRRTELSAFAERVEHYNVLSGITRAKTGIIIELLLRGDAKNAVISFKNVLGCRAVENSSDCH